MPIKQIRHFTRHAVGRHPERLVDMDVALGDPSSGVSEQSRDRQFGKAEVTG
jgi:hypothetical protein